MMGCDAPRPMAAPITLTLALSHRGRGDTAALSLCLNPDLKDFKDGRNVWGCMNPLRSLRSASPFC